MVVCLEYYLWYVKFVLQVQEKHPQRAPLIGKNLRNQSPRNGEPQEENQQQKGNEEEKGEIGDGADSSQIESPKALPSSNQSPPQDASQDSGQKGGSNGENYSGVDSIYPEKSVFNQSAYSRRSTDRHPKSRRSTDRHPKSNYIEVDKAGFITQLSEISDVSSLSSKMTHLGTDGLMESLSSGEAVQFSPRNRPWISKYPFYFLHRIYSDHLRIEGSYTSCFVGLKLAQCFYTPSCF